MVHTDDVVVKTDDINDTVSIVDDVPGDRILHLKIRPAHVGYCDIELSDKNGNAKNVTIFVKPSGEWFELSSIGQKESVTFPSVGLLGVSVSVDFLSGPSDPGDKLKWTGGGLLGVYTVSCEYLELIENGVYKFKLWVRGVTLTSKEVTVIVKNKE